MSTPTIHRISESEYYDPTRIKVPAWLWSLAVGWRHRKQPFDRLSVVAATHWHPDQPEAPTTTPTPAESAPQSAPAQGETPRIYEACLNWDNTGDYRKRLVSVEYYEQLKRELNEAKPLYAAALDTLKDMSAQVVQLTGARDRMDAEIAMLTADLFRATSERDQARQDLEERCAENDRERAAHSQAYQAAVEERDEARQWLAERPSTELYDRAVARNEELCSKLTAVESELAELRKDRELLDCVDSSTEIQVIGGRNEFDQPFWIAQHRHKTQTIDCAGKSARDAIRCLMNRLAAQGEGEK